MADLARRSLCEAIATFFLVFIGVGAVAVDASTGVVGHVGVSLAFGFVVAAMVYSVGHLSGAHLNPAVTLAFRAIGRFPGREVPAYVGAQILGACGAALLLGSTVGLGGSTGATLPTIPLASAWVTELALTFGLMFVIVGVATDDRSSSGVEGMAIGLAVGMGALAGGPVTGGSMNPARSFGPALVTGEWTAHWLYWTAPVCGAVLGAIAYEIVRSAGPASPRESATEAGAIPRPPLEAR